MIWQALQAVAIGLDATDDPYLIFESLNHKGQPLTQADLIRNNVLMRFPPSANGAGVQEEVYHQLWKPLEEKVGEKDLSGYLRHYGMIDGGDVRNAGIYVAMKERFDGLADAESVRVELARILRLATAYRRFLDPQEEDDPDRRRSFSAFQEAKQTTPYPLLLALEESAANGDLTFREHTSAIKWVEAFVIRRLVCGVATNALRRVFISCCNGIADPKLRAADGVAGTVRHRLSIGQGGNRWPKDDEVREAFMNQPQYGRKSTGVVLRRLEHAEEHKEPVDLYECSIEHVLPRTLTDDWRADLGEDPDETHSQYIDRFGNLTLTAKGYNTEMGNRSFEEKRKILSKSHVELNRWIVRQDDWGPEEIEERGRDMAERAVQLWPAPLTKEPAR